MSGTFITFEGIEGCGKSTHAEILLSQLVSAGHDAILTREPGGTVLGETIREIVKDGHSSEPISPEAEMLLFAVSRAHLVRNVILPALRRGTVVISDRFVDSTSAYQGCARGLDPDVVASMNRFVAGDAVPDVTILLDIDVEAGLERIRQRNDVEHAESDRIEKEARAFHEKVREAYLALARDSADRIRIVDASQDVDKVAGDVWRIVEDVVKPTL